MANEAQASISSLQGAIGIISDVFRSRAEREMRSRVYSFNVKQARAKLFRDYVSIAERWNQEQEGAALERSQYVADARIARGQAAASAAARGVSGNSIASIEEDYLAHEAQASAIILRNLHFKRRELDSQALDAQQGALATAFGSMGSAIAPVDFISPLFGKGGAAEGWSNVLFPPKKGK